jgi:hypothetical protein
MLDYLFSGLILKAMKGDFAEDDKLKVKTSCPSSVNI